MAKINFNKVEQVLENGLRQYGIKQLLYLADLSSSFGFDEEAKEGPFEDLQTRSLSLHTLYRNLQILRKKDANLYKQLDIDTKKMKHLIENPNKITDEEWSKIQEIRTKIDQFRKELRAKLKQASDEEIVKSERKKHKDKRFNIKDGWLPLH